jgi:hypothetical protein
MNDIRIVIRNLLIGSAGVQAITDRIFVGWIPPTATLPAISILVIKDRPFVHLSGPFDQTVSRIQIDIWGERIEQVVQLRKAVYETLQMLNGTYSDTAVYKARLIDETDRPEKPKEGASDNWIFRVQQDWVFQYKIDLP